jgi:hypothetical protein
VLCSTHLKVGWDWAMQDRAAQGLGSGGAKAGWRWQRKGSTGPDVFD